MMSDYDDYEYKYKYIIIGDSGTGKSSLLLRFVSDMFVNCNDVTVGVEFGSKVFEVGYDNEKIKVKAQIWDTAGQESYKSITRSYFRSTAICLVVFDITRRHTYHHVDDWINEYRDISPYSEIILIGNKCDLESRRTVSADEAFEKAAEYGIEYIEVSSKTDSESVSDAFITPALVVTQRIKSGQILPLTSKGITLNNDRKMTVSFEPHPSYLLPSYNCCSN